MGKKGYIDELERALSRPDADQMRRQLIAYAEHNVKGTGDWPDDLADDFGEIISCHFNDPDKSLAYVVLAVSQSNDAKFLGLMGCSNLENVLHDPSPDLLQRIVAEAQRSARFRWLLSHPFEVAIAERAWDAIAPFRIMGAHEEPLKETFPSR